LVRAAISEALASGQRFLRRVGPSPSAVPLKRSSEREVWEIDGDKNAKVALSFLPLFPFNFCICIIDQGNGRDIVGKALPWQASPSINLKTSTRPSRSLPCRTRIRS
jgi:hypothetical protein